MGKFANQSLNDRYAQHEDWSFKFGDKVQNMCASDDNPQRTGLFVKSYTMKGVRNPGKYATMTNGSGKFWDIGFEAIEPLGWLPALEQERNGE